MILIPYPQLSPEQQKVIRSVSRNEGNLFIEGAPGSGKTLISLYTLKDYLEKENLKVMVIMYNHSLYGFLRSAFKELEITVGVTIATKDKFFWDLASKNDIIVDHINSYEAKYNNLLSNLSALDLSAEYDLILIDEVQDLQFKEFNILKSLGKKIITLGDFKQGVYESDLDRKEVEKLGFFQRLTGIYRYHKKIAELANPFTDQDLVANIQRYNGDAPKIIDTTISNQFEDIYNLLKAINTDKSTGIICPSKDTLNELSSYLNSKNYEHFYYSDNKNFRNHDFLNYKPILLPLMSSKGLEFENVILFGFNKEINAVKRLQSVINEALLVAITRTKNSLYIVRTPQDIIEVQNLKVEEEIEEDINLDDWF